MGSADAGQGAGGTARAAATEGTPASVAAGYLEHVGRVLQLAAADNLERIRRAAELIADRLADGGMIHAFGTGHSHMLAEEVFYRAGGLARVDPILVGELMLHEGAARSTERERSPGLAARVLASHPIGSGDVLIAASNSGGTRVTVELARAARERGALVIAVTSLAHARSNLARAVTGPRLHEVADVVLDTHGSPGDAAVDVPGTNHRVGPTSTVVGAALLQALVAEVATVLAARGLDPEVFASANSADGDAVNAALLARYRDRVRSL